MSPLISTLRIQDRLGIVRECNIAHSLDLECTHDGWAIKKSDGHSYFV